MYKIHSRVISRVRVLADASTGCPSGKGEQGEIKRKKELSDVDQLTLPSTSPSLSSYACESIVLCQY